MKIHIKLLISIGLTVTSGLVCMTAFGLFYTSYFSRLHAATSTTKTEEIERINIIAVGDIMLSRNVARHAEK